MKSRLALIAGCAVLLAGCSTPKIWPFYKKPKPAPEAVHELDLLNNDGTPANYPQYWKRNTLVIDLTGVSGTGGLAARLPDQSTWPVRIGVRVRPGSVEQIEVQGEERNVLAVRKEGVDPIDMEFAPSVYRKTTAAIYINWGLEPQFAEAVIESTPAFVSPMDVPKRPDGTPVPGSESLPAAEGAPAAAPPAAAPAASVPADTAAEPEDKSASEIMKPADASSSQPSPPPGS